VNIFMSPLQIVHSGELVVAAALRTSTSLARGSDSVKVVRCSRSGPPQRSYPGRSVSAPFS